MKSPLRTRRVRDRDEIRTFFDAIAEHYRDSHGHPARLLARRLGLIRQLIGSHAGGVLLDVGCGPGVHLFPLAADFRRVIGVDLAPRMIAAASRRCEADRHGARIELHTASAEDLGCVAAQSVDVALCTGVLEHVIDKTALLGEVNRALKPDGRFVCLTVNGDHLWYRRLAPRLGYDVKHLSTDAFVGAARLRALLTEAGFDPEGLGYWSFVARGDMPAWAACMLQGLERFGGALMPRALRGGLYVSAGKIARSTSASTVDCAIA